MKITVFVEWTKKRKSSKYWIKRKIWREKSEAQKKTQHGFRFELQTTQTGAICDRFTYARQSAWIWFGIAWEKMKIEIDIRRELNDLLRRKGFSNRHKWEMLFANCTHMQKTTKKVIWLPGLANSTIKLWRYAHYFSIHRLRFQSNTLDIYNAHASFIFSIDLRKVILLNFGFVLLCARACPNINIKNGKQTVIHVCNSFSLPLSITSAHKSNEDEKSARALAQHTYNCTVVVSDILTSVFAEHTAIQPNTTKHTHEMEKKETDCTLK